MFQEILLDEHNRVWLSQAGRQLIADLLRHASKDPSQFYLAYDAMMEYLNESQHLEIVDRELKQRGVSIVILEDLKILEDIIRLV